MLLTTKQAARILASAEAHARLLRDTLALCPIPEITVDLNLTPLEDTPAAAASKPEAEAAALALEETPSILLSVQTQDEPTYPRYYRPQSEGARTSIGTKPLYLVQTSLGKFVLYHYCRHSERTIAFNLDSTQIAATIPNCGWVQLYKDVATRSSDFLDYATARSLHMKHAATLEPKPKPEPKLVYPHVYYQPKNHCYVSHYRKEIEFVARTVENNRNVYTVYHADRSHKPHRCENGRQELEILCPNIELELCNSGHRLYDYMCWRHTQQVPNPFTKDKK